MSLNTLILLPFGFVVSDEKPAVNFARIFCMWWVTFLATLRFCPLGFGQFDYDLSRCGLFDFIIFIFFIKIGKLQLSFLQIFFVSLSLFPPGIPICACWYTWWSPTGLWCFVHLFLRLGNFRWLVFIIAGFFLYVFTSAVEPF